ncbi:MAG: FlgD immunoglobulin-like domain containing protein, partial [Spirochaetaceae bacterium]|nr:FlgD immunoglobulin-like domain containing protein [Spirochaetaceae bacterium]
RAQIVKNFTGANPVWTATWDGMTASGAWIEPSKTYTAKVRVRDEYGNAGETTVAIEVRSQPDATEASAVKPIFPGFSPTGDAFRRTIDFSLQFGNAKLVQSWALEIATGDIIVKRYAGKGGALPTSLTWDGNADNGLPWPEGEYRPVLSLDYGQVFNPSRVEGQSFKLISSPPAVKASASPPAFMPSGTGMAEPVTLSIQAESKLSKVASWTATFLDPKGATMRAFNGTGASGKVSWDGGSAAGVWGEPGKTYSARIVARDEYGNAGETIVSIPVRDMPEAPAASLIEVDRKGFSPQSSRFGGRMGLSLIIGASEKARSWKVEISDGKTIRRAFAGTADDAPATLSWDGLDDKGGRAPDGTYSALLSVDYGRTYKSASSRTKDFVLASSAPGAKLSASPDAFTPTEEGVTGPVALVLEAAAPLAKIDSWTLEIIDSQGKTVQSFARSWPTNQAIWDGKTLSGSIVEAGGSYRAKATVVDEYGNESEAAAAISVKDIPAATERSRIEPRSTGFSPSGSGKPRSMDFILLAGNADRLKTWKLTIAHSERGTQKTFSGTASAISGNLSWDGKTDAGAAAPDGSYYATLSLDYGKSFRPAQVRSASFALQAAPPEATLTLSPSTLKPKAGAFEKPAEIALRASARYAEIESWIISVLDPAGKTVALFKDASPGTKFSWDGKTSAGGYLDSSTAYTVVAEVRDSYGNAGTAKAQLTVGDLPPVPGENSIVPAAAGLSPNGDGTMDSIDLRVSVTNRDAMRSWKVIVSHAETGVQKTFSGDASSLGTGVTWLGRADSGELSPEGAYSAALSIDYGTTFKPAQATSRRFVLTTSRPKTMISVSPRAVVPDEQGFVAPARFALDANSALARMSSWSLDIVDSSGRALASLGGDWPPSAIGWNGVMEDGRLAEPNSAYTAVATVLDEFGNSGQAQAPIIVAGFPTATEESFVKALSRGFSPAAKGSMRFSLGFGNRNLVKSWRLDIEREDKTVRLRYPGDGSAFPETFVWDGRLVDGTTAPDGRYSATLYIDYGRVYSAATAASAPFSLASAPPSGSITIDPGLFSPDGDGSAETCAITLTAVPQYAAISDWSVEIQDPAGNAFMSWRGQWPAKTIVWDGKNPKGDSVESAEDYPLVARLRDEFGNSSEVKSAVKVDILVTKIGDEYRLRVGGVTFKSFTADYMDVPEEQALRNAAILDLLASKLKKFPGYQIKMVGHAVMTSWDDPA